jgi:hypothetical protein
MTFEELLSLLSQRVSGVRAKEAAERIAAHHRVQASPGYDEALGYVRGTLESLGIECATHDFRADGRSSTYERWVSPPAWRVASGVLRQTEPESSAIATYDECPQHVVVHSPAGEFDAEVVHVGEGTSDGDYESLSVSGRIILACGRASEVVKKAAGRGAVGLVVYPNTERAAPSYDLVQYASFFPKAEEIPDLIPGFSVSRRTADRLLKQLSKGEVRLVGEVDAEFIDAGHLRVLEAWIPGADQDRGEVLLVAHLCHPRHSANDNASGSAVLLELARAFHDIRCSLPLHQTVRFLWVPEFYGTLPWAAANAHALGDVHFVLNLDMVGQSPELVGTPLNLFRVSNTTPHYLNACVRPVARAVAAAGTVVPGGSQRALHWRMEVPSGGSDHLVFAASPHELPALMLNHDDPYWHTSLDTMEKVDPTRLKHVGMIAGALASVPSMIDEASHIPEWLLSYCVDRLAVACRLAKGLDPELGHRLLRLARDIEEERIASMADLEWSDRRVGDVRGLIEVLNGVHRWMESALPTDGHPRSPSELRPLRATDGPLPYAVTDSFDDEEKEFFRRVLGLHHRAVACSLFNLCDGTRTADQITLQLMLDFDRPFEIEDVERGIRLLEKAGCVEV